MEKCTCNGTGYVTLKGERVPCICKIIKIYDAYLKPFKNYGPPHPNVVNFVNGLLIAHRKKEMDAGDKVAERLKRDWEMDGGQPPEQKPIEPIPIAKHWFMIDPLPGPGVLKTFNVEGMGNPTNFVMHFFFQYLVRTKEYMNYRIFDLVTLQNIYYGYGDGEDFASADTQGVGGGFYGYACDTFLLHFKNILPGKESFNILRHFIDTYRSKNIIIVAESSFRQTPKIRKWSYDDNKYIEAQLFGEKTLQEILSKEYDTFIDLTAPKNDNQNKG